MARRKLLTPDERQALLGIPDDEESLIRHYTLSTQDRLQAEARRRPHNQLGYAVQLCIMRFPGRIPGAGETPRRRGRLCGGTTGNRSRHLRKLRASDLDALCPQPPLSTVSGCPDCDAG